MIAAHHQKLADAIREYIQNVYGTDKTSGTTDTQLNVVGEGIDLVFRAK